MAKILKHQNNLISSESIKIKDIEQKFYNYNYELQLCRQASSQNRINNEELQKDNEYTIRLTRLSLRLIGLIGLLFSIYIGVFPAHIAYMNARLRISTVLGLASSFGIVLSLILICATFAIG